MKHIYDQIDALVQRAKAARLRAATLDNPATVAGDELATDLAAISRDFVQVSVALRQEARETADAEAAARPRWKHSPKMTAAKAKAQIIKRGGYTVPA